MAASRDQLLPWCSGHSVSWCVNIESGPVVPAQGNGWQWTGEGELGHFFQADSGSEQVWWETGPALGGANQSTSAASSCHKRRFSNLPWGWDRSNLFSTSAGSSLCAVARPLLLRTCKNTHTMTSLLEWKNAPWGAAHPRMQLCLRLEPWWITVGNLKSLQRSDLYQKWGQLEYAPFNVNCTYSWIPYHLVSATPSCQGREPLSLLKPKGGEHFLCLGCRYFNGNMGNN